MNRVNNEGICTLFKDSGIKSLSGSFVLLFGTPTYLCIAEHLQHICVKRFHGLVVAREDLLLNSAQVQRVRHLLIILAVPGGKAKEDTYGQRISKLKRPIKWNCLAAWTAIQTATRLIKSKKHNWMLLFQKGLDDCQYWTGIKAVTHENMWQEVKLLLCGREAR